MLAQFAVSRCPTIGGMYEGLSAEVLTRALPEGLDLTVVSGLVVDLPEMAGFDSYSQRLRDLDLTEGFAELQSCASAISHVHEQVENA